MGLLYNVSSFMESFSPHLFNNIFIFDILRNLNLWLQNFHMKFILVTIICVV
jgi:hypothetical protein